MSGSRLALTGQEWDRGPKLSEQLRRVALPFLCSLDAHLADPKFPRLIGDEASGDKPSTPLNHAFVQQRDRAEATALL